MKGSSAFLLYALVATLFLTGGAHAHEHERELEESETTSTPYDVEAAFIYNFLKFTEFPPEAAQTEYSLCVLGDDVRGLRSAFRALQGKKVREKPIDVSFPMIGSRLRTCDVLFVSLELESSLPEILQRSRSSGVLLVGENDSFCKRGGLISFYREDDKLRFQVNLEAVERQRLTLSSKLLTVAKVVRY